MSTVLDSNVLFIDSQAKQQEVVEYMHFVPRDSSSSVVYIIVCVCIHEFIVLLLMCYGIKLKKRSVVRWNSRVHRFHMSFCFSVHWEN